MSVDTLLHLTHQQIHFLRIILESGSFARASTILDLDPSTISKSIQRIERHFGLTILARHGKGVSPTRAGSMLLEKSIAISNQSKLYLENIRRIQEEDSNVAHPPQPRSGTSVSIGREVSDLLVGVAYLELRGDPFGKVALSVDAGTHIEERVREGSIDIGVLCDAPTRGDLDVTKLGDEALMIVCGPQRALELDALTPRLHALSGLALFLPGWEHSSRRIVEQSALRAGTRLEVRDEISDFAALKSLLRQGLGYAILPHCSVAEETGRGSLCARPLVGRGSRITLSTVSRAATREDGAVVAARQGIARCLAVLARSGRNPSMSLVQPEDAGAVSRGDSAECPKAEAAE